MSTITEASRLAELLEQHVGDDLRGVLAYWDREKVEIIYVRDDIETELRMNRQDALEREFLVESLGKNTQEEAFNLGPLYYTVRCFRDATVLHFTLEEGAGTAASLDSQSSTLDEEFLKECLDVIKSEN